MDGASLTYATTAHAEEWERDASLGDFIAREVIPRLVGACRPKIAERRPAASHAETLTRLALSRDARASLGFVETLLDQGYAPDALLEELIAASARRLNGLWMSDVCDFVDVALAATRLGRAARAVGARAARRVSTDAPGALVLTPEGERHELGPLVLAETLRVGGWRVVERLGATASGAAAAADAGGFLMIAVSIGSRCEVESGRALVGGLAGARRSGARLLVGGAGANAEGGAAAFGADACLGDARAALAWGRALLPEAFEVANKDAPSLP